jgi:plasmid stabilization system protein ParE
MKLSWHRSDDFNRDFDLQYQWFLENADEAVAGRYLDAVLATMRLLATQPGLGRLRKFRHPALQDIRSFRVASPFEVHLLFYRQNSTGLFAERLMHAARNLPKRLMEPPGSPGPGTDSAA